MKFTSISLLLAAAAVFVVARTLTRIRRDQVGIRPGLLWACMWSAVGYFALFPSHLDSGLALAQMENRMFFITVIGLFVLFTRVFGQETQIERLHREVAHLVQELALMRAQQPAPSTAVDSRPATTSGAAPDSPPERQPSGHV